MTVSIAGIYLMFRVDTMRTVTPLALALALSGPALPPPPVHLDADQDGVVDSLQDAQRRGGALDVLLGLRTPPARALAELVEAAGGVVTGRFDRLVYLLTVRVDAADLPGVISAIGPELTWAQLDGPVHGSLLNATRLVRTRDVWRGVVPGLDALTGAGARVGVIDSGVDSDHPDLRDKVDRWLDVAGPAGDGANLYAEPHDRRGHGTAVASVAAGAGLGALARSYRLTLSRRFPPEEGAGWNQNFSIDVAEDPRQIRFVAEWDAGGGVGLTLRNELGEPAYTGSSDMSPWSWGSGLVSRLQGRRWQAFFFTRNDDVDTRDTSYFASLEVPHEAIDDFSLMSGVARDSFVAVCKALDDQARAGGVGLVIRCLEWMGEVADEVGLAAVNLSLNFGGGGNGPLDTAVNELVTQHGVAVIVSAGNDQQDGRLISSPGTAALALTVGAHTTEGAVTLYSSLGERAAHAGKPDVIAPGGSLISGAPMFVADANDAFCKAQDWECGRDEDPFPDDHVGSIGTSLAAPVVAGAMALLVEARGGDLGDPLEAKALLLMTALETGDVREVNPDGADGEVLGATPGQRGFPVAPWDRVEGYGRVSIEAFLEAAVVEATDFPVGGAMSAQWAGRQVWARRVRVPAGRVHRFAVFGEPGVIYEIGVYSAAPDAAGRPALLGAGVAVSVVAAAAEVEAIVVVRRIEGEGAFSVRRDDRQAVRCAGHPEAEADAPQPDSFCTLGRGGCERTGRWSCDGDGWAVCETQQGAAVSEICGNGVDDDCDGQTDEDDVELGEVCDTGALGPCSAGVRECLQGAVVCVAQFAQTEESCDGTDEDCDGSADEGFDVGAACRAGAGACEREGALICAEGGKVAVCDAAPAESGSAERCGDDVDNDCDGGTDEGFDDLGAGCTVGIGACAVSGAMVCDALGLLICGAASVAPGGEVCGDGVDGDCDGEVDEGCDAGGAEGAAGGCGGCAVRQTSAGSWGRLGLRR